MFKYTLDIQLSRMRYYDFKEQMRRRYPYGFICSRLGVYALTNIRQAIDESSEEDERETMFINEKEPFEDVH